eukprot:scaffold15274_cov207-Alexandrium_tamarense.AAC.2
MSTLREVTLCSASNRYADARHFPLTVTLDRIMYYSPNRGDWSRTWDDVDNDDRQHAGRRPTPCTIGQQSVT